MVGAIALRGSTSNGGGAFLTLVAGMRTPTGCNGYPAAAFGVYTDQFDASWVRLDGPGKTKSGEAKKTGYRSSLQQFEARTRQLAGKKWNCLVATLTDPEDASVVYDEIDSVRFRALPGMALRMPKIRKPVPVGKTRRVRIVVSNPGQAPLRNVRLRIGRDRGLVVRPVKRRIAAIAPGRRKAVYLTVRPTRAAGSSARLRVFAKAGKLQGRGEFKVRVKQPRKKPPRDGGGGGGGVCVKFFPDFSGTTGGSLGLVPC